MNGTSSAQQDTQPQIEQQALPKKKKRRLFGILSIIGLALVLLLTVLNNFNILRLSNLFPSNKSKLTPQPIQKRVLNYSPNIFRYDIEKAKTIISQYAKDTIKAEFIPEKLDIKQGLSIDNRVEDNKRQFGSYFTANDATFSINFHYKENTNIPNDFTIFIQPENIKQTTVTSGLANSLVTSYFNNPFASISNCDTKTTTSYCEEFKTEPDGKKGFGVILMQDQLNPSGSLMSIVFTCFVPRESKNFDTQKSCISL